MVEVQPEHEPFYRSGTIVLLQESTDTLKLLNPNADSLVLGDATHEGGDIKVYRDASGNLALSFDADAASNAKALDIYGGVVCQNHLTVGQASLDTSWALKIAGASHITGSLYVGTSLRIAGINSYSDNATSLPLDITVTDGNVHGVKLQIDTNNIIVAQATGDGSGGIQDLKALLYAPIIQAQTPQTLTGAGAVDITSQITHIVTAGVGDALTLADGQEGQQKIITTKTETTGGDTSVLTPANFANGATITFDAPGDVVTLVFSNGSWHWSGGYGVAIA